MGLSIHAPDGEIRFAHPALPGFIQELEIRNLKVGAASLDLVLRRYDNDVGINVARRDGDIHVVAIK